MKNVRLALAGLVGLLAYLMIGQRPYAESIWLKATGRGVACPWSKLLAWPWSGQRFKELQDQVEGQLKLVNQDASLKLEQYATPTRTFWIKGGKGDQLNGKQLLAYVLAEQMWLSEIASDYGVRKGDVVMDVGAHIGTFGDDALKRGAAKVIMVEVDPVNVECIRRNFAKEIEDGRVVLIPEGAWNEEGKMDFVSGVSNSGTGSLVLGEEGGSKISVPVRPIDSMLKERGLAKVDFVKMDIEGAEREALKGAREMLTANRARVMLDSYHRVDDDTVLPALLKERRPDYQVYCAVCGPSRHLDQRLGPYALFFY